MHKTKHFTIYMRKWKNFSLKKRNEFLCKFTMSISDRGRNKYSELRSNFNFTGKLLLVCSVRKLIKKFENTVCSPSRNKTATVHPCWRSSTISIMFLYIHTTSLSWLRFFVKFIFVQNRSNFTPTTSISLGLLL